MDNMRSVQAIFNVVVLNGFYPKKVNGKYDNDYMCNALYDTWTHHNITSDEYGLAMGAIKEYLGDFYTLYEALKTNGLPATASDRLAIYKNWVDRPVIRQE
jgi:hypothetical protein